MIETEKKSKKMVKHEIDLEKIVKQDKWLLGNRFEVFQVPYLSV